MKIAIVVQGRFHAFDLAKALIARGHDVTVFTNYPKWAVGRFGIPSERVRSFWLHGVLSNGFFRLRQRALRLEPERLLNPAFGRWAAGQLSAESWDVVHGWSGISEEILTSPAAKDSLRLIMRGSAHIRAQGRILEREQMRTGRILDRPGPWITAREEREYRLAERVVVLSTFAYDSFLTEGVERSKLRLLPLGTNTAAFRPAPGVIEARCQRILSGNPLRIMYVGTLSMRKGACDLAEMIRIAGSKKFKWRFVGPIAAEAQSIKTNLREAVEFISKQRQPDLPKWYAWGDVFVFPTVEDGFAVVLAQAQAGGLPLLATTNCCGPDLIHHGQTGWILPIRSPEAFVERLLWCDSHREALAQMVRNAYVNFRPRDWDDVAADFESLCAGELAAKRAQPVA